MKILIAIDESDQSQAVVASALLRANSDGSSFQILHVVEPFYPIEPGAATPSKQWGLWVDSIRNEKQTFAKLLVAKAAEKIRDKLPNAEILEVVREGVLVDQVIVDVAETWGAELIFTGPIGKSSLQPFLLGSVSYSVLLHSPCAIEIVRNAAGINDIEINHVLIALDDSAFSNYAFDFTLKQQWKSDVCFKLVTVLKPFVELFGYEQSALYGLNLVAEQEKAVSLAKQSLDTKAQKLQKHFRSSSVSTEVLVGDAREMILKESLDWPAQLIIMGSHSRRGVSKFLLGSVSQAVAMHASCSVQVVKLPKPVAPENRRQKLPVSNES